MTVTLDNLAARYQNGAVHADWPVKPEGGTDWSTVESLLAAESGTGLPPQEPATTSSASDSSALSVGRRYRDAYLVARTTTAIGGAVKFIGIGLGLLVLLAAVVVGSQTDRTFESFVGGCLVGAVVAVPLFVLGVLVSAVGQSLKATLDTAVHSSPFLKREDMARVMSL